MKSTLLFSILFIFAVSSALARDYSPIYQRDGPPANSGWSVLRNADPQQQVQFTISLQRQNLWKLEELFWAVSDPTNELYAEYLPKDEIRQLVAPSIKVQKEVLRWIHEVADNLPSGNLFSVDNQLDAIVVRSTVSFAETLFQTQMKLFHNSRNNAVVIKHIGTLSIPDDLAQDITFVSGITELPPISDPKLNVNERRKNKPAPPPPQPNNECNNPFTIKNLYGIPQDLFVDNKNSNASVYSEEGGEEGFGLASIEDYQNALGLPPNPIKCILGNAANDYVVNDTDTEANLDTEMLTGIAPNVSTCFYIMSQYNGWMYEFSRQVMMTPNAPLVVSMSYGWNENQACDNGTSPGLGNCTYYHIPNSQQYVNLTNVNFQMLGVAGHTILASSGDGGTAGNQGTTNNCATLGPLFPAGSPYLTSVGGTSVEASNEPAYDRDDASLPPICTDPFYQCNCSSSTNEQPALGNNTAGFDTGGGFSIYTPRPSYQQAAVNAYLNSGVQLPASKYFNASNRGYPDVAGVAENVCLLDPGNPCSPVAGTSCSAPLWAGIVSLLNNDRFNAGKKPLGFLNPVIYQMFAANPTLYFNNGFESGNNNGGCGDAMGYNAKPGYWTPLTGVGSPNFAQIRKYIANLK